MACNLTSSLPTFHMTFEVTKVIRRKKKILNILSLLYLVD